MPNDTSLSGEARRSLQVHAGAGSLHTELVAVSTPPEPVSRVPAFSPPVSRDGQRHSSYMRIGMTVFEAPEKALAAVCALTGAGLGVDQVVLIALGSVISECANLSTNWSCLSNDARVLFDHVQHLGGLSDGEPLVATSASLFEPIHSTIAPSTTAVTARARDQYKELEDLLRAGAVAVVAQAADSRQQQTITRVLLANSQHRVTTYDVPHPARA